MRPFLLTSIILAILVTPVSSKDLFQIYDLTFSEKLILYHVEDLNHDNLKDILVLLSTESQPSAEKCFSVFFQTEQGFSGVPDQTFKLDEQIIVFDLGDVVGDFSKEFVFFTQQGLFYYPIRDNRFILKARKLFDTDSMFMLGNNHLSSNWNFVADLNGDHIDEILIPKITGCNIYFRNLATEEWLLQEIPLAAESKASGFYEPRFSVGNKASADYSTPYIFFEDFNSDGRRDLMAAYTGSLAIFLQDERGFFSKKKQSVALKPAEIWHGAKIRRTRISDKSIRIYLMKIKDLNQDGIIDAVYIRVSTKESVVNPKTQVEVHYGKRRAANGQSDDVYFSREPDQVIEPGGTQLVLDIVDLNHDQKIDLIIPVVKVGLMNIISMLLTRRVEIHAETYLMNSDGLYEEKPNIKIKLVVKFTYRGGATAPVYEVADFNGDGHLDIMSSLEEKKLVFFWGNKKNVLNKTIGSRFNVFLPQNGDLVKAIELNGDNKSDVIINYGEDNAVNTNLKKTLRVLLAN
ncbi:hypothetical protein IH785_08355 [candidate division KSB1 bacterium]|nr:hypothetical protein [candidate division KSB1 bacterium]